MNPAIPILRAKVADRPFPPARSGLAGFGENHPRPAPVFSPKTLPVEAVRSPAPEIGNDMFHPLTIYGHENEGIYRKTDNRQMDKDDSIAHRGLHRVRLSVFKRRIARVDGSRHRLFQGILQVSL